MNSPKRDFTRKNFGEKQNLMVLAVLALFLAAIVVGLFNNIVVRSKLKNIGMSNYPISNEYKATVRNLESTSLSQALLPGDYMYKLQYEGAPMFTGRYTIHDNNKVSRQLSIEGVADLYALSDYRIVGSVIKYENVQGDKYLLNDTGSPLYSNEQGLMIELDGNFRLLINSNIAVEEGDATINIPDSRSWLQKLLNTQPLALIQNTFVLAALLLLMYILYRINFSPTEPKNNANKSIFEA